MSLRASRKIPKEKLAYGKEAGQHMKLLLTGSVVAAALAGGTLLSLLRGPIVIPGPEGPLLELTPSVWMVSTVWLAFFAVVQYRMWADLRDRFHALTEALYRHHPMDGDGISVQQVQSRSNMSMATYSPPFLEAKIVLERREAEEILVTCDGPVRFAVLLFRVPRAQASPPTPQERINPPPPWSNRATMISPSSFRVKVPSLPLPMEVFLQIHADQHPAIVCVEWLSH